MLFNYYKIALRHLRSIYSLINLSGLTIGLTVFIFIFLWVEDELSYDHFHVDHDRIFRVVQNQLDAKGLPYRIAVTPPLLCDYLKTNFVEVEKSCRAIHMEVLVRYDEQAFNQEGLAVDPSFFSLFSFPLVNGSTKLFFEGIDKIILSDKMAEAYFGKGGALGKVMKIAGRDFEVVAIVKVPANSHLKFDFAVPIELLKALGWETLDQWDWQRFHTYIKLRQGESQSTFGPKIKDLIKRNLKEATSELELQPLDEIHLRSGHLNNDMPGHQDIQYVYIFSSAALFILLIACINYTNLATARSMRRAKEVGIRAVAGATRSQLMIQYFSESLLYCLLALGLALGVSWLFLPWFNELSGKTLTLFVLSPKVLFGLGTTTLCCGVLTGIYPAVVLSSLRPSVVLKGLLKTGWHGIFFRRTLVIVQFTLSIVLVLATLIVEHQLSYIRSKDMGYDKEHIITFHITRKLRNQYPDFKQEIKALNGVANVTVANANLSFTDQATDMVRWEGKDPSKEILFHQLMVDHDFIKTFSMQMAEGRDFSESIASDSAAFILNEEAARQMNISNVVGSTISMNDKRGPVIGVVKNFNFKSVHKKIEPMVLFIDPDNFSEVAVKMKNGDLIQHVKAIEKVFKKFSPDRPFEYTFLDQDIDKLYKSEQRTGKIFTWFSVLAIFISGLGLLSILIFTVEQRRKEMAIRKVMGASVGRIFLLISKEFIALIVIGNAVALPLAIYLMNQWLAQFAYFENITPALFIATAGCSIVLTWLAISFFCLKVATANPVDSLRNE